MTDSQDAATSNPTEGARGTTYQCLICSYSTQQPRAAELGRAPGNTERFKSTVFPLWQCPKCQAIHSVDPVDMADIYSDYPLNRQRQLDVFARGTFRNLLGRLTRHGIAKDQAILDYGCGNGVYIQYLNQTGYTGVTGYDPYVAEFADQPAPGAGRI